ncbi:hypothetical protein MJO28_009499 [Puccinia striiformis f. sp. tritici]|uniref:Uncharacterized protein n=1 Tax=Puccinia striiformis f. sp. tritici TaxID=168172 RepID=A0ACC0E9H5_9BASI|nr:hypothetical protein MJO28_009499 [Puccinia striiformis f. sp. tritici]KAI7950606.1 hypothetical protein MJO29_009280 [Puccinia striiformis f. sp. tritici]
MSPGRCSWQPVTVLWSSEHHQYLAAGHEQPTKNDYGDAHQQQKGETQSKILGRPTGGDGEEEERAGLLNSKKLHQRITTSTTIHDHPIKQESFIE